jgi:hypothetical protein
MLSNTYIVPDAVLSFTHPGETGGKQSIVVANKYDFGSFCPLVAKTLLFERTNIIIYVTVPFIISNAFNALVFIVD